MKETKQYWLYDLHQRCWTLHPYPKFSTIERRILHYSACGYSQEEMASQMCLSVHTVKSHKQSIFKRLHITNMLEALSFFF